VTGQDETIQRIQLEIDRAVRGSYSRGFNEGQTHEKNRQAAIERNGGTPPDYHQCHFCGEYVANGYTPQNERHHLSDCRPDLVQHEPGEKCTWHGCVDADGNPYHEFDCYAYQDRDTNGWGPDHKHFYEDGPM